MNKQTKEISNFIFDSKFPIKCIEASKKGELSITIPLANNKIEFLSSIMLDNSTNVIKCKTESIQFLIFQHVTSSDFIYIYNNDEFILNCHSNMEIAKAFLAKYFNLTQGLDFSASSFGGLIASHGRPAHFFYDTALGIQSLY